MLVVDSEHKMTPQDNNPPPEPRLDSDQQSKNNLPFSSSLGRQSSIYSLTLDEFQHTLSESGKNFGSMNMDEFLNSIWTAEENQAMNNTVINANANANSNSSNNVHGQGHGYNKNVATSEHNVLGGGGASGGGNNKLGVARQSSLASSLARQGSLTLPAPLCRKTVDEVWSEIHKTQQQAQQRQGNQGNSSNNVQNTTETATRQPTFGEMTLEDFLIKAGVVSQQCPVIPPAPPPPQQQQQPLYGLYQNSTQPVGPSFIQRPIGGGGVSAYQQPSVGGDTSGFPISKRTANGGYGGVGYGAAVGNGGGGYVSMGAPVSPVSSDGLCGGHQVENSGGRQYGMEVGGMRGKNKRIIDGPTDKVVERRQRRMIKNRESAARSRARKQAYTVELEAELNQLKEENAHLKQALAELEHKRKQQYFEDQLRLQAQTRASRAREKLRILKRNSSWPL